MSRVPAEPFDCTQVDAALEAYLHDRVSRPERRGMRLHIHRCPVCFRKVTSRDPLQLFAPLADVEYGDRGGPGARGRGFWEDFWPAIQAAIQREEARPRPAVTRRALARYAWGALAAAAVVAAGLAVGRWAAPGPREGPAAPTPQDRVARLEPSPPASGRSGPLPQTVERVRGSGAGEVQVYSMQYLREPEAGAAAGARAEVTELVLIVDAGLEL